MRFLSQYYRDDQAAAVDVGCRGRVSEWVCGCGVLAREMYMYVEYFNLQNPTVAWKFDRRVQPATND